MARSKRFAFLILTLLNLAAFSSAFRAGFMDLDDDTYLTQNPAVAQLTWKSAADLFVKPHEDLYKPLTLLSFAVERRFFGLNPAAYHTTNVILHILNSWLVWLLVLRLLRSPDLAWVSAIVFAVHPLRVESVVWITERKDVLYGFLYLLSILFYLRHLDSEKGRTWRGASLSFFVLSLLAKPIAVTLPLVLLIVDKLRRRPLRAALIEKIPFFLIAACFSLFSIYAAKTGREVDPIQVRALHELVFTPFWAVLFYIHKFVWPAALSTAYPHPLHGGMISKAVYFASPILVTGGLYTLWRHGGYLRNAGAAVGLFILTALPILQIIPTNPVSLVNDHNTYLPSIGLGLAAAYLIRWLSDRYRSPKPVLVTAAVTILALLTACTWRQSVLWEKPMLLWNHVIEHYPALPFALNHRGNLRIEEGDYAGALADFERAIALAPDNAEGYNNRANVYGLLGQYPESIADFDRALSLRPDMAGAYVNRANIHVFMGNMKLAERDYARAALYDPSLVEIYSNRGNYHLLRGDYDRAFEDFDRSIRLNPSFARGYNNRGTLWNLRGNPAKAVEDFTRAIELEPSFAKAYMNRAKNLAEAGQYRQALDDCDNILLLDPKSAEAYGIKGAIWVHTRQYSEAIEALTTAIALNPRNAVYYNNRATAHQMLGDNPRALKDFTRAINLDSGYANAYNNRGNLYLALRNYTEALDDLNRALRLQPEYTDALLNRAQTHLERGSFPEAQTDLRRVLSLPHAADSLKDYARRKLTQLETNGGRE